MRPQAGAPSDRHRIAPPVWPVPPGPGRSPRNHSTSTLRDSKCNLFEVLGTNSDFGTGPRDRRRSAGPHAAQRTRTVRPRVDLGGLLHLRRPGAGRTPAGRRYDHARGPQPGPGSFLRRGSASAALPTHLGGYDAPPTIRWAGTELLAGGHATTSL